MLHDIALAIWFFLPAAVANAAPIPCAKLPYIKRWNTPIDGGRTFRGKPLLGPHKTWRGIVAGIVAGTLTLYVEQQIVRHAGWAARLTAGENYQTLPTLILGPLFAIGALGGDALKSFFKRQRGTKSGATWIPFDQIDYIVGGALLAAPYITLSVGGYVWLLVIGIGMHFLFSYLGYVAHLKDSPI